MDNTPPLSGAEALHAATALSAAWQVWFYSPHGRILIITDGKRSGRLPAYLLFREVDHLDFAFYMPGPTHFDLDGKPGAGLVSVIMHSGSEACRQSVECGRVEFAAHTDATYEEWRQRFLASVPQRRLVKR